MKITVKIHSESKFGLYAGHRIVDISELELAIAMFLREEECDPGIVVDEIILSHDITILEN